MRVPLTWLREYCDPPLDVHGIEERLTMTGTKVEAIHHHGVRALENFVVGRVLQSERHPDADRLSVCEVDLGQARPEGSATIVCGAANVAAGQSVAVARPGAVMPDGSKLKKARLRGVPSEGMILAEDELAIGSDHDGIMVLEDLLPGAELTPGAPLQGVLPLATEVLELEVTPNRPDCLGVYGVARELHAATGAPLAQPPWTRDPGSAGPVEGAQVQVQCPDLCPRFTARVLHGVSVAPSPPWLKARLMASGQRPINNVVDITNYAMLLSGQPLHAFDLDRVAGARLVVRRARDGEQVQTLDGQTRVLDAEMVVIDDADGPTSIAGLMGGARSEVAPETTSVLLEVANWHGPAIHRASWALGLRSEASSRFEKGLQPEQCLHAQAIATQLMIELCGATVAPGTIDVGGEGPAPRRIRLRSARVEAILGRPVARERQAEILGALDFHVAEIDDDHAEGGQAAVPGRQTAGPGGQGSEVGLDVSVPALRRDDVTREADLIEEVARIDGLEKLPATLPKRRGAYGLLSPAQRLRRRAVDTLVGRGLYEAVGWTFTPPSLAERLRLPAEDPRRQAVAIENPLSEEQSRLRTTLLGSLLDVARHNLAHGTGDLRLFEHGTVFRRLSLDASKTQAPTSAQPGPDVPVPDSADELLSEALADTGVAEHRSLAVLLTGRLDPKDWRASDQPTADLFAAKALLEALAAALRVSDLSFAPEPQPFLHPGRGAAVLLGEQPAGWLGELHPLVAETWELPGAACLEVDFDLLIAHASRPGYVDLIGYPPLRQDLAVVLPVEVSAAAALAAVTDAGGKLLADARVFDVYSGPQVGEGRRSLALALAFRASDRTLSDEEVAPVRERIVAALAELGGELRG